MKGNEKIAFTAEAISYMRAHSNSDRFSKYFISPQIKRKFKKTKWIIPDSYLKNIFQKRINLSYELDKIVRLYNPEQIIECACGYSPRGLIMTQNNPDLIYIEADFPAVINRKKKILKEIETAEGITLSKKHHLISVDLLNSDLYDSAKGMIDRGKKTLVIAETLTSYLNPSEHEFLVQNIERLLNKVKKGAYLSHENNNMLPGLFGRILLFYRDKVAKTKSYRHFKNSKKIESYFLERGSKKVKIIDSEKSSSILYLVINK